MEPSITLGEPLLMDFGLSLKRRRHCRRHAIVHQGYAPLSVVVERGSGL
jgi:hypothetical protein